MNTQQTFVLAYSRVTHTPALAGHAQCLLQAEWAQHDARYRFVATAPLQDVTDWCTVHDMLREAELFPEEAA